MLQFNEKAFRQKFTLLDQTNEGKLSKEKIEFLLGSFEIDLTYMNISSIIKNLYLYSNKKNASEQSLHQDNQEGDEEEDEEEEEERLHKKPQEQIPQENYKLDVDQALRCAHFFQSRIQYQFWKVTCKLLQFEKYITQASNRQFYPIKDPAQDVKINIIVGKQEKVYNSFINLELKKCSSNYSSNQSANQAPVFFKFKVVTKDQQASTKLDNFWKQIFEQMIAPLKEVPELKVFFDLVNITSEVTSSYFAIKVQSRSKQINQLIETFSKLGDRIFKTELQFKIFFSVDFNFDLGEFLNNQKANIYDFLTQNIRIKLTFQASQYVTALKELMIANGAFTGLSYVSDDPFTLRLIALVNLQNVDINLRFKNDFINQHEQQTIQYILLAFMQLGNLVKVVQQAMPNVAEMLKEILKYKIELQVKGYDLSYNINLNIRNLDKLIFGANQS